MKHLLPYNSRISFEVTPTDEGPVVSCGLVSAQGIVGYWPVAARSDHGPQLAGTQYSAVQVLIHHDMSLEDVLHDLDTLRELIELRHADLQQAPRIKSQNHDPSWRESLSAREHVSNHGKPAEVRRIKSPEE